MDEQFNNELKNRISKMFENFEHPSADKGWQLLQEKLPEIGKNRGINWLWAASVVAAVLLIFFGVNTLVKNQDDKAKSLSQKTVKHLDHENKTAIQKKEAIDTFSSSNHTAVAKNSITDTAVPKTDSKLMARNQPLKIRPSKNQTLSLKGHNTLVVKAQSIKNRSAKNQTVKPNNEDFLSSLNKKEDAATGQTINTAENLALTKNTDTSKTITKEVVAASSIANSDTVAKTQSLIAAQNPVEKSDKPLFTEKYDISKPRKIVKKDRKKIEFGIYEATYFNYAQGSSNQLNAGAGVTADIRLFKNLKLSTGLAIAQNTLDYGNQLPNLNSVVNTGATLAFNLQQYASNAGVAYSLILKNYTAKLVGLDVPLNLKYEFNSQKNDRYFSMGLSSGTFIHQSYTYQYNYSSVSAQTIAINTSLSSFYFAKTLNVAFGLGYPIGKTNRLIIEPFLKYPLSGLGDEGIRFGASGINLKFDFQSSKK